MASRARIIKPWSLQKLTALRIADVRAIGKEVAASVSARVFPESGAGRDSRERPFSAYSVRPTYISKKSPPRPSDMPAPRGLTAGGRLRAARKGTLKQRGLTNREMKTVFYPGGYSQYRASIGRTSGSAKNLTLSGRTKRALRVTEVERTRLIIGFGSRQDRADVLDAKYGFMALTTREKRHAAILVAEMIARRIG